MKRGHINKYVQCKHARCRHIHVTIGFVICQEVILVAYSLIELQSEANSKYTEIIFNIENQAWFDAETCFTCNLKFDKLRVTICPNIIVLSGECGKLCLKGVYKIERCKKDYSPYTSFDIYCNHCKKEMHYTLLMF